MSYHLLIPFVCIAARGILNVIDRNLIGIKQLDIKEQLLWNNFCPFVLGLFFILFFFSLESFVWCFFTWKCFFGALVLHSLSLAFSLCFKRYTVREVMILAKIADVIMIALFGFAFLPSEKIQFSPVAFGIVLISCFPYFFSRFNTKFFFSLPNFFLTSALCLQFIFSINMQQTEHSAYFFEESFLMAIGILLWRLGISIIFLNFSEQGGRKIQKGKGSTFYMLILTRAVFMLVSYFTFIYSIEFLNPSIVLPILNSGPLVSLLLARFILEEEFYLQDIFLFLGLCVSVLF